MAARSTVLAGRRYQDWTARGIMMAMEGNYPENGRGLAMTVLR